jgi:[protein-PII] uridylyltransferase
MNNGDPVKCNLKELIKDFFPVGQEEIIKNGLGCSYRFSQEIERTIKYFSKSEFYNFAVVSGGSLSRRELAPYSDIDITIISLDSKADSKDISSFVTDIWDSGIEISHTVRELSDIEKFSTTDLHVFTSLLETSFICGNYTAYEKWLETLSLVFTDDLKRSLFKEFVDDMGNRYTKHGSSSKMIEPNVKLSNGGLRDFQLLEWIYILTNAKPFEQMDGLSQSEHFINTIFEEKPFPLNEIARLMKSYKFLMTVRNVLHLNAGRKTDRLDFEAQIAVAEVLGYSSTGYKGLMKDFYTATGIVNRFLKSFLKRYRKILFPTAPSSLSISLDNSFYLLGDTIYSQIEGNLSTEQIMKAFYLKADQSALFDEKLRSQIVDSLDNSSIKRTPATAGYFKKILLQKDDVGITLASMHELGVLGALIPEFEELSGYIQHGVYHSFTADEHTIYAIINVEKVQHEKSILGRLFNTITKRDLLYLAILFHDIAKPLDLDGHHILGAEIADSFMQSLGYREIDIELVKFLVRSHLLMAHTAFKRDLNSPETLNLFVSSLSSIEELDLLYLLTYADLSAVNSALWTSWKNELLSELYRKTKEMILEEIPAEELLFQTAFPQTHKIMEHSNSISSENVKTHIDSFEDLSYANYFSEEEMARHIEEIVSGSPISVLFKQLENFTNVTIITFDSESLLAKLCGVFLINDVNIHDAKIFTRKDSIIIDSFTVSDFRTNSSIDTSKFKKIEADFVKMEQGMLQLSSELQKHKSKWWRLESKFFKKQGKISVKFEESEKYTIIDIHSPDRLGFLYKVTSKLNDLGLNIHLAKILTMGSDIVDSFYVLDNKKRKVSNTFYTVINDELKNCIEDIL